MCNHEIGEPDIYAAFLAPHLGESKKERDKVLKVESGIDTYARDDSLLFPEPPTYGYFLRRLPFIGKIFEKIP